MKALLADIGGAQWRVRESAALAMADLLQASQPRAVAVGSALVWSGCFSQLHVRDISRAGRGRPGIGPEEASGLHRSAAKLLAVALLLQGRRWGELQPHFGGLWEMTLR